MALMVLVGTCVAPMAALQSIGQELTDAEGNAVEVNGWVRINNTILVAAGNKCTLRTLSDEEYLEMIDAKLDEELAEYHKDKNIEELGKGGV